MLYTMHYLLEGFRTAEMTEMTTNTVLSTRRFDRLPQPPGSTGILNGTAKWTPNERHANGIRLRVIWDVLHQKPLLLTNFDTRDAV